MAHSTVHKKKIAYDDQTVVWFPDPSQDCSLEVELFTRSFSHSCSLCLILQTLLMRERTLCRPTRIRIVLIYKRYFAMMSLFLFLMNIRIQKHLEQWLTNHVQALKAEFERLKRSRSVSELSYSLEPSSLLHTLEGSGIMKGFKSIRRCVPASRYIVAFIKDFSAHVYKY